MSFKQDLRQLFKPYFLFNIILSLSYITCRKTPGICNYLFTVEDCEFDGRESEILFFVVTVVTIRNRKTGSLTMISYLSSSFIYTKIANLILWFHGDFVMGIIYTIIVILMGLLLPEPAYSGPDKVIYFRGAGSLEEELRCNKGVVWVVAFYTVWNSACANFAPIFAQLSSDYCLDNFKFGKVDVGRYPDAAVKYWINDSSLSRQLPTIIVFKEGKEIDRRPLIDSKGKIIKFLFSDESIKVAFDFKTMYENFINKIINSLSKIGDDIFMEPKNDHLILKTINMTATAYCTVTLHSIFFTDYEIEENISLEYLFCKLPMKGIMSAFKQHLQKDRNPEFCKIELEQNATKILFRFNYKNDVTIVKTLYLSDGHFEDIVYHKERCENHIGASAQMFAQVLTNFQAYDVDISLEIMPQKMLVRNYASGESNVAKSIRSQIIMMAADFSSYKVDGNAEFTFSLKPFKAAIQLAESFALGVLLNFEVPGRPMLLGIKNTTFMVNFVTATLNSNNEEDFNEHMDEEIINIDEGVIPPSPQSPCTKKMKSIFERCNELTFQRDVFNLGDILAPDSDPDDG
ncbi:hypothetical protein FQA39_LY14320 [Lamprigera yunnana]|nr:hypothetical protein FQA39_LY14320 [Lamprigera yunnana]